MALCGDSFCFSEVALDLRARDRETLTGPSWGFLQSLGSFLFLLSEELGDEGGGEGAVVHLLFSQRTLSAVLLWNLTIVERNDQIPGQTVMTKQTNKNVGLRP